MTTEVLEPQVKPKRKKPRLESAVPSIADYLSLMKWSYRGQWYQDADVPDLPCGLKIVSEIHTQGGHDVYLLQNKALDVWVFTGTYPHDIRDWLINFNIRLQTVDYPDWTTTRAHRGASDVISVLHQHVNRAEINPYSKRKLVLVGHSQGFMKACAAVPWALNREYEVALVVGAGCPRVGDTPFVNALCAKAPVLPFTHGADPVRFLPLRFMGGYEAFSAIHLAEGGAQVIDPDGAMREWFSSLLSSKFRLNDKRLLTAAAVADHDMDRYIEAWQKLEDSDDETPKRIVRQFIAKSAARCGIDPVACGAIRLP